MFAQFILKQKKVVFAFQGKNLQTLFSQNVGTWMQYHDDDSLVFSLYAKEFQQKYLLFLFAGFLLEKFSNISYREDYHEFYVEIYSSDSAKNLWCFGKLVTLQKIQETLVKTVYWQRFTRVREK